MSTYTIDVGKALTKAAKIQGMSFSDIAMLTGRSYAQIITWKNTPRSNSSTIELLCNVLDMSPDEFIKLGQTFKK